MPGTNTKELSDRPDEGVVARNKDVHERSLSKDMELDEYLELLYHLHEVHDLDMKTLEDHEAGYDRGMLQELERQELITLSNGDISLTEQGFKKAEGIIRRHRLAERLLTDVLHMSPEEVEKAACEYEHMVAEEITESICILLGHPRTCPHGSPIPPGPCCRDAEKSRLDTVVPLTQVPPGTKARIAHITSPDDTRQHRLAHLGIVPGSYVRLHQLKPSVVVMCEGSTLAMEEGIAKDIFVWKTWS